MEFKEYILFVGNKLEELASKGDKEDWVRIAKVLIATIEEQIRKLEK